MCGVGHIDHFFCSRIFRGLQAVDRMIESITFLSTGLKAHDRLAVPTPLQRLPNLLSGIRVAAGTGPRNSKENEGS